MKDDKKKKGKEDAKLTKREARSKETEEQRLIRISEKKFALGKNYRAIDQLGKGTYGTVYKAYRIENPNEHYAIKKIKMDVDTEGIPSTALREIAILKKMRHPNIVNIVTLAFSEKNIELCLEYCDYDWKKLMDKYKKTENYTLKFIKSMIYQIIKATEYLHSHKILHRDLKPQNILVTESNLIAKLADFGLSRVYSIPIRPYTKEVLTLWYRAPEMMWGMTNYSTGLDIWSWGCIFAELFAQKPVFVGDCEIDQLFKIMQVYGTFNNALLPGFKSFPYFNQEFPHWNGIGLRAHMNEIAQIPIDNLAFDLLERMWMIDPTKRISCKEALIHPFFNDVILPISYTDQEKLLN